MTSAPEDASPIFVVGMNGSGTSVLNECLNRHPKIYGFRGETKVLPFFIKNEASYGPLDDDENFRRLWEAMANSHSFKRSRHRATGSAAYALPSDWRETPRRAAAVFHGIMSDFARRESKVRWSEKSPLHALHIRLLADAFPLARFIHIVRDGRDAAASLHRRWRSSPLVTICRWKQLVVTAEEQGAEIAERYLKIHYESLTTNSERELQRVCEFLGEEFHASMLDTGNRVGDRNLPARFGQRLSPNSGKFRDYFSADTIKRMERIAGQALADVGYEPDFIKGDRDPSKIIFSLWRGRDVALCQFRLARLYWKNGGLRKVCGREHRERITESLRQLWAGGRD